MRQEAFGIIVAGGDGIRMAAGVRKQYLLVGGRPILALSIAAVAAAAGVSEIFLVVPEADFDYCRQAIISPLACEKPIHLVAGGNSRQASVLNGLDAISASSGVAVIHDGVRPLVATAHIEACIRGADNEGACILGVPAQDTVKQVSASGRLRRTLDRQTLWMAQTPQAFDLGTIRRAHAYAAETGFHGTDDAAVVEHCGGSVRIIQGSPWNIKITTPEDLKLAELIWQSGVCCGTVK